VADVIHGVVRAVACSTDGTPLATSAGLPPAQAPRLADRRAALSNGGSGVVVRPAEGTFTSGYGARDGTIHFGIDIADSIGTPILSAMDGEVIDLARRAVSACGSASSIPPARSPSTATFNESLVRVGQQVSAGEQIATMGNRGQSTGPAPPLRGPRERQQDRSSPLAPRPRDHALAAHPTQLPFSDASPTGLTRD
jgi:biotin carboxyl carrier protein